MPIYEYECSACGKRHEVLQKMSEQPLQECPTCHASALKKLLSAAGFRLAGSGWYETDFKKDKRRNLHESSVGEPTPDSAATASEGKPGTSDKSSTSADKPSTSSAPAAGKPSAAQSAKKKTSTS